MQKIDRLSDLLSTSLKYISASLMFSLSIMILTDVLARLLADRPILGISELVANSVVAVAFLQLGYTVRTNAMLRVEVIDTFLGERTRSVLQVLRLLVGALFFALIVYASWGLLIRAWTAGEYAAESGFRIPTFPVRGLIVFCSALAVANFIILAIREATQLRKGSDPRQYHGRA